MVQNKVFEFKDNIFKYVDSFIRNWYNRDIENFEIKKAKLGEQYLTSQRVDYYECLKSEFLIGDLIDYLQEVKENIEEKRKNLDTIATDLENTKTEVYEKHDYDIMENPRLSDVWTKGLRRTDKMKEIRNTIL